MTPEHLICGLSIDGKENGVFVDGPFEVFWHYGNEGAPGRQYSYRIRVFEGGRPVYDSGESVSRRMRACVPDFGFSPAQDYELELSVRTDAGEDARRLNFSSAMCGREWGAQWISGDMIARRFSLPVCPDRAKLFVTGLGYYHCFLNGVRLGNAHAAPTYTDYAKRVEYQAFDVTDTLRKDNLLVIVLGSHFEEGVVDCRYYRGEKKTIFRLCADCGGKSVAVVSDRECLRSESTPFLSTSVYNGEKFDAENPNAIFYSESLPTEKWLPALSTEGAGKLYLEQIPPVSVKRRHAPCAVYRTGENRYTLDFGVNITGVIEFTARSKGDASVTLRHAELLNEDMTINPATSRIARAEDYCRFGGGVEFRHHPWFTYHGFRYTEAVLEGLTIEEISFEALEISTVLSETGEFECSDEGLNAIHRMMKQTLENTLYGIPTDCSQRDERQGWLADAHLAAQAVMTLFDAREFYLHFLDEISFGQNADGSYNQLCAPPFVGGNNLMWTGAYYMLCDMLWREYGDLTAIERHYESLKRFFSALSHLETERGIDMHTLGVGDWLGQYSSENHTCFAVYCDFARKMQNFARLLGRQADEAWYAAEAERLKAKYNKLFYDTTPDKSGAYGDTNEISEYMNALSVCFGLCREEDFEKVCRRLAFEVEYARGEPTLTTGLVGTKYLFEALDIAGRNDLVLALLRRKSYPSYQFMLSHGATTVWERWEYLTDNNMNSHCHSPLCAPIKWLYESLCGIRNVQVEDEEILFPIRLCPAPGIERARAEKKTQFGKISVSWKRVGGERFVRLSVPGNCRAEYSGRNYGPGVYEIRTAVTEEEQK